MRIGGKVRESGKEEERGSCTRERRGRVLYSYLPTYLYKKMAFAEVVSGKWYSYTVGGYHRPDVLQVYMDMK